MKNPPHPLGNLFQPFATLTVKTCTPFPVWASLASGDEANINNPGNMMDLSTKRAMNCSIRFLWLAYMTASVSPIEDHPAHLCSKACSKPEHMPLRLLQACPSVPALRPSVFDRTERGHWRRAQTSLPGKLSGLEHVSRHGWAGHGHPH